MTNTANNPTPDVPPVPTFATEDEIRDFWDTHDSAPYFDQMEDVTTSPPPGLRPGPGRTGSRARRRPAAEQTDVLTIRLPEDIVAAVTRIATDRRLSTETILRSWITERLDQERKAETVDSSTAP